MPAVTENKHVLKTRKTKAELLDAAEELFLKHGYEKADMASIAAMAGRSTGAIYAHFRNKEEIFLALFEENIKRKRDIVLDLMAREEPGLDPKERWKAIILEIAKDRRWPLFLLEFKLFALRHPEVRGRLKEHLDLSFQKRGSQSIEGMKGALGEVADEAERDFAIRMMGPILSAMALESAIFPEEYPEAAMESYLARVLDMMLV